MTMKKKCKFKIIDIILLKSTTLVPNEWSSKWAGAARNRTAKWISHKSHDTWGYTKPDNIFIFTHYYCMLELNFYCTEYLNPMNIPFNFLSSEQHNQLRSLYCNIKLTMLKSAVEELIDSTFSNDSYWELFKNRQSYRPVFWQWPLNDLIGSKNQ